MGNTLVTLSKRHKLVMRLFDNNFCLPFFNRGVFVGMFAQLIRRGSCLVSHRCAGAMRGLKWQAQSRVSELGNGAGKMYYCLPGISVRSLSTGSGSDTEGRAQLDLAAALHECRDLVQRLSYSDYVATSLAPKKVSLTRSELDVVRMLCQCVLLPSVHACSRRR